MVYYKKYNGIITIEPGKRGGKPCIRGMRITVGDILGWLATGMTFDEIICDFPELTTREAIPTIGSVKGFPPKIIWLRTGNLRNQAIVALFEERTDEFVDFIDNEQKGCLMIYPDLASDNETTIK